MANFTTHIAVGTLVSGSLATLTVAANVVTPDNLIAVTLAGVLGSVLPDIDLKDSRPSRALFSGLAIFFSFCVLFMNASRYSIAELWVMWLGTLVLVRYGGEAIFQRFSYHRGIFHSLLAGAMFALLTAVVFRHVLGRHEGVAWLAGGFMMIGYLTHLILDELYSVDVMDRRLKVSFGTALKLIDAKHPGQTAAIGALAALFLVLAPTPKPFVEGITAPGLWEGLRVRLLPQEAWFDGITGKFVTKTAQERTTSNVTTGALPDTATSGAPASKP
ncbi:MAG: metal-dependent hydrolase [Hyphomicrobiaceae bacterium]